MIHSSPVGVDTSDIELAVDSVGKLLTDINQQVFNTTGSVSLAFSVTDPSVYNSLPTRHEDAFAHKILMLAVHESFYNTFIKLRYMNLLLALHCRRRHIQLHTDRQTVTVYIVYIKLISSRTSVCKKLKTLLQSFIVVMFY